LRILTQLLFSINFAKRERERERERKGNQGRASLDFGQVSFDRE